MPEVLYRRPHIPDLVDLRRTGCRIELSIYQSSLIPLIYGDGG